MKIMIIDVLPDSLLTEILSQNITYRPDLRLRGLPIIADALSRLAIDALILRQGMDIDSMLSLKNLRIKCIIRIAVSDDVSNTRVKTHCLDDRIELTEVDSCDLVTGYICALNILEKTSTDRMVRSASSYRRSIPTHIGRRDAVLVGAGLVNLVSAYRLMEEGWEIRVIDAAPDPSSEAPWMSFGCSRGGDDARMFTLSEMDNYNDRLHSATMNSCFNSDVASFGWGASRSNSLTDNERNWISDFETLPPWLANRYNDDIFSFSRASRVSWDLWRKRDPELFIRSEVRSDILRIYSDRQHLLSAIARQNRIGATIRLLSPSEISAYEPALSDPAQSGAIAGGIVVVGFTVNAHKFMGHLVSRMKARGAQFDWNTRVERTLFDENGFVRGLLCEGRIVKGGNYVLSPGAYGRTLLEGTKCESRIHGVLGAWLRLPNLEPCLQHSLKLARKGHITEDANITVATDVNGNQILIIGSGYGHTGLDPMNVDDGLLNKIYGGLIDTAERFFPKAYAASRAGGNLEASLKYCVRPWTSNGLGLFEIRETDSGGNFVVTGGHNTGGFAQSPTISDAVIAALEGRYHEMHSLYHPDRASSFLERENYVIPEYLGNNSTAINRIDSSIGAKPENENYDHLLQYAGC